MRDLLGPLQTALVPVLLSSTSGHLCLLVQTGYGRIVDHTRPLLKVPEPHAEVQEALEMLFKRARYAE